MLYTKFAFHAHEILIKLLISIIQTFVWKVVHIIIVIIPIDHEECENNMHQCDHICYKTQGKYICSCFDGYSLVNTHSCEGMDECITCFIFWH